MQPLDYSLCNQTVTLYRRVGTSVQRWEEANCFYQWQQSQQQGVSGVRRDTSFLLVLPGLRREILPGDRVFNGVGPLEVDWAAFVPAAVSGLSEVGYVQPFFWEGKLCHVEAGRK